MSVRAGCPRLYWIPPQARTMSAPRALYDKGRALRPFIRYDYPMLGIRADELAQGGHGGFPASGRVGVSSGRPWTEGRTFATGASITEPCRHRGGGRRQDGNRSCGTGKALPKKPRYTVSDRRAGFEKGPRAKRPVGPLSTARPTGSGKWRFSLGPPWLPCIPATPAELTDREARSPRDVGVNALQELQLIFCRAVGSPGSPGTSSHHRTRRIKARPRRPAAVMAG